jgi:hypothetical protein
MKPTPLKIAKLVSLLALALGEAGCTNVLGFSTATKFGLDVSQRSDQMVEVSMGYDRAEVASIPAPKDNARLSSDEISGEDAYSVLGTFDVHYGSPFGGEPLVIDQLFATGFAARQAAGNPDMQAYFGKRAHDITANPPAGKVTGSASNPAEEEEPK